MFDKEDNKYLQAMQGVISYLSVLGLNRAHSATDSLMWLKAWLNTLSIITA